MSKGRFLEALDAVTVPTIEHPDVAGKALVERTPLLPAIQEGLNVALDRNKAVRDLGAATAPHAFVG